jgi:hypothetical protein
MREYAAADHRHDGPRSERRSGEATTPRAHLGCCGSPFASDPRTAKALLKNNISDNVLSYPAVPRYARLIKRTGLLKRTSARPLLGDWSPTLPVRSRALVPAAEPFGDF